MGAFDDIIKKATAEDLAIIQKYPDLRTSFEHLETEHAKATGRLTAWDGWAAENFVIIDPEKRIGKTKQQIAAEQAREAAEARVLELEALPRGESDMTFEEIEAQFRAKGYVPATEIDRRVEEKLKAVPVGVTPDRVQEELNKLAGGFQVIYGKTAPLVRRHFDEFAEDLDMASFLKFAGDRGMKSPEDIDLHYKSFVLDKREAKRAVEDTTRQAELDAKIAAAKAEGEAAGRKAQAQESAMGQSGRMPTDQIGAPAGHLERRVREAAKPAGEDPAANKVQLGDGLAGVMYDAYLKEKAAASVQ